MDGCLVHRFLTSKLLTWLEALALLESMPLALEFIGSILELIVSTLCPLI